MNSIRFCLLAGLFSLCLFVSCKKDSDPSNDDNNEIPQGISAKIDGIGFTASSTQGIDMGDVIWLIGSKTNGSTSLTLRLPIDVQPGTYSFPANDPNTLNAIYTYLAISTYRADSGKIVVTKHDTAAHTLEGTFEIVCKSISSNNTVSLKEGTFNMSYQ
jgi:hypothetical protein